MSQSENDRIHFEEIIPCTWLLRVPFGPVWTGIVLVRGEKNFLVDSSHLDPERYLVPALEELGLKLSDVDWLLNTHCHGDHVGGHHALVSKYGLKTACLTSSADALRDPVKVAIRVRTKFPENSPPPQSYLKGVEPDKVLAEGELLEGRFLALSTPGHDDDCVVWIDTATHTAFTGDSLQGNGTPTQGIGFYRDLRAYRRSMEKLLAYAPGRIENIVCGHEYDGVGDVVAGAEAVGRTLRYCIDRIDFYDKVIGECADGAGDLSERAIAATAVRVIEQIGCGMPEKLFLAMHTVDEHLREGKAEND